MKLIRLFLLLLALATVASAQSSGPATTIRFGTADPASCTPGGANIFYRTDTGQLKTCTAVNTWTVVGAGGGSAPAGSGSEIQARLDGATFQALTGSSISGGSLSLGGNLTFPVSGKMLFKDAVGNVTGGFQNIGTGAASRMQVTDGGNGTIAHLNALSFRVYNSAQTGYSQFNFTGGAVALPYTLPTGYATAEAQSLISDVNGILSWGSPRLAPAASGLVTAAAGVLDSMAGTSGGIPYYSSTTALSSSALLAANAVVLGGGAGTAPKTVAGITSDGTAQLVLGVNTTTLGSVKMFGNTSGNATIQPAAVAGTSTVITLPNATATLPGLGLANVFTETQQFTAAINPILLSNGLYLTGLDSLSSGVALIGIDGADIVRINPVPGVNGTQIGGVLKVGTGPTTLTDAAGKILSAALNTVAVANGGTGITSFGTGVATFLGTPSSANLLTAVTDETGTGAAVFGTSPAITTSLTTSSSTFALLNTTATTVNAFGATTALNLGASATMVLNFGGSTTASEFRFLEPSGSGTNYSAFKAVAQGADITYSLPPTVSAAGGALTDVAGNGVLTWVVPSGAGTVTATGGSLTANAVVLGAGTTDTKVLTGITTNGTAQLVLGVNVTTLGSVKMFGNTSGDATVQPAAVAGTATVVTLPNASSTLPIFGQQITFTGPTAARSIALPDAAFTVARTDAANTFTGASSTTSWAETTPVITGGLTASGSGANTFAGSTGTFLTSTGAVTIGPGAVGLSGITTLTPPVRASGIASYYTINIPADTGQTASTESIGENHVTGSRAWATTGTVALQRERFFAGPTYTSASASQTFTDAFNTYFTPPIAGTNAIFTRGHTLGIVDSTSAASSITGGLVVATTLGTTATSVGIGGGNVNAGGNGTFGGTLGVTGAATLSSTLTQTSASATAFESGLNGGTNPVFRLVNNIASTATGISITGRAAAAGVDITVLSSGTNEDLNIVPKGTGSVNFGAAPDVGIARNAANVLEVNTGVAGTFASLKLLKITSYNNTTTTGLGVPVVVASTRVTAQTAANASISTFTVGAADGSFEISANMNVTAATTLVTTLTCTYTDESNTARTMIFPVTQLSGSFIAAGAITGTGAWETSVIHIRAKAATAITILTSTGTFTSVTYTAEGIIKQTS